jgi:hypothetical protein
MQVLQIPQQESWAHYLASSVKARQQEAKLLAAKLAVQEEKLAVQEAKLAVQEAKLAAQDAKLQNVFGSISWQVTRPIRKLHYEFPESGKFVISSLKLLWWTFTFKLYRKLTLHFDQRSR